jgi:hypothetical protein
MSDVAPSSRKWRSRSQEEKRERSARAAEYRDSPA